MTLKMGALGGIINSAIGAARGSSGTSLQDFLNNFSSSEGIWIKQIDPIATFDVSIKFYPSKWDKDINSGTWYERLGSNLASAGMKAVKNLANNVTGGLLGSIMNSQVKIMEKHDSFSTESGSDSKPESHTFMEYLAAANLLVGKDDWVGEKAGQSVAPLELQLGPYCQEITIPGIEIGGGQTSQCSFGEFPINGLYVKPDANQFQMKIVNTRVPLLERLFYPWARETVSPFWNYASQPYTTATVTVDMSKHNDISYVFVGCRPQKITTQQANQQASSGNLVRDVSFIFDYMFVTSSLQNCESLGDKLLGTAKTLLNGASKMLNA